MEEGDGGENERRDGRVGVVVEIVGVGKSVGDGLSGGRLWKSGRVS